MRASFSFFFLFLFTIPASSLKMTKGDDDAAEKIPENDSADKIPENDPAEKIPENDSAEKIPEEKSTIFLDLNGVLNAMTGNHHTGHQPQPELVDRLRDVVKKTNADIVLDSAARLESEGGLQKIKKALGDLAGRIVGYTPVHTGWKRNCGGNEGGPDCRVGEIEDYLKKHPDQASRPWIAMDDANLEKPKFDTKGTMAGHWSKTKRTEGLTDDAAEEAIKKLNDQKHSGPFGF